MATAADRELNRFRKQLGISTLDDVIRKEVYRAIQKTGNIGLAGQLLGVGKTTIYRYLKNWGESRFYIYR